MVFPVVMYRFCESWIIKKTEHQRIDAFDCGAGEDSWESLGLQGDQTSQFLKEIIPEYSLEGLMLKLKLQYFACLRWRAKKTLKRLIGKDSNAGKDWRQKEKGVTEKEMVSYHHQLNGYEF